MLGVVVRFARHRGDDKAPGEPASGVGGRRWVGRVFEDFEDGHAVEGVGGQCRRDDVKVAGDETRQAAGCDRLQLFDAVGANVAGVGRQVREGVEQRPKEDAATAADIEQIDGSELT